MNRNKLTNNNKADTALVRSKQPNVFSIPRPYEDDFERNDAWYKNMKRLEAKIQELKQSFNELSVRQNIRKQETKEILQVSRKLINKFLTQKNKD